MNAKHREVREWLGKVYGSQPTPQYEISARTVEILHNLMKCNTRRDDQAQILIDDYRQKAAEYRLEAGRLLGVLQDVGVPPDSLSQSGTVSLKTLSSLALMLHLKDTSDTSYLLGLSQLSQDALQLAGERKTEDKLTSQLIAKTNTAMLKADSLKRALVALEEQSQHQGPALAKKAREMGFLHSKIKEYRNQIEKLEVSLQQAGVEPSLFHSSLVKKSQDLKNVEERLAPLQAKLDSYHSLPPDVTLAKVKLEETRQQLANLEQQLATQIDLIHMK